MGNVEPAESLKSGATVFFWGGCCAGDRKPQPARGSKVADARVSCMRLTILSNPVGRHASAASWNTTWIRHHLRRCSSVALCAALAGCWATRLVANCGGLEAQASIAGAKCGTQQDRRTGVKHMQLDAWIHS